MKKISFKKDPNKQYDENIRNTAKRKCVMIYVVAAYIIYQGYGIIHSKMLDQTTMGWTETIVSASILIVASLVVAVFATIKMGREFAESEIIEPSEAEGEQASAMSKDPGDTESSDMITDHAEDE